MKEYVTPENRESLLRAGLVRGDVLLASGVKSSLKYEIDNIRGNLFLVAADAIADCIADNFDQEEFNTIFTVAYGANSLGDPIVDALRIRHGVFVHHIPSHKDKVGDFYLPPIREQDTRGVIVDDVYTTGKSMRAVKVEAERTEERWALAEKRIGAKVIGAAALLNRSADEAPILSDGVPVFSAVHQDLTAYNSKMLLL